MILKWNRKAQEDRRNFLVSIGQSSLSAALKHDEVIEAKAELLLNPLTSYKAGRVLGTHEFIISKRYVLVYRIKGDVVEILRVLHTAQAMPTNLLA
ncbi:type II toxin-antitoxin system RelE/ParE family toxin [Solimicrobium silvestre]|uniref:Addiction module toxin, RelE/StbE family n=1 Tax=Solimicrobium silvestre TaxID=2099400 RepID=A0A2S9GZS7_9BURK|nr:type II toxin-antitoxin system RelE/ParE family toxin [Solimicrobium silvestre]PRC93231.1 Addiction module toxin, RelE/StbE family [Solimicrobium silvestre]